MEITRLKQEIGEVIVEHFQTLEDNIEDGVQTGTNYVMINDAYGNQITIEDGMLKHVTINGQEYYNHN